MTMQAMQAFLETVQTDPAVAEQLVAIIGVNPPETIYPKVVTLAGANGFDVTEADVAETRRQFEQVAAASEGDLCEADLESVSGGVLGVVPILPIISATILLANGSGLLPREVSVGLNEAHNNVAEFLTKW